MRPVGPKIAAACLVALFGQVLAQTQSGPQTGTATVSEADRRYAQRVGARFRDFAGSVANLESLAAGLRHGTEVTLGDGIETVAFAPPTRPMGYGNVTRALDLAARELAQAGITQPTPQQLRSALLGGTVTTAQGDVSLQGVLQLRNQGMGWGQIAHAIGVHPGLGARIPANAAPAPATGITTAQGASAFASGARIGAAARSSHGGGKAPGRAGKP